MSLLAHKNKINMTMKLTSTMLPNAFIDNFMSVQDSIASLVYIFCYRHVQDGNTPLCVSTIADGLGVSNKVVIISLNLWQEKGLLQFEEENDVITIAFFEIEQKPQDSNEELKKNETKVNEQKLEQTKFSIVSEVQNKAVKTSRLPNESRPNYHEQELEKYQSERDEIKKLFKTAETVLSKLLNHNDRNVLFGLYDWLGLPVSVIEIILTESKKLGKASMFNIEKMALDWAKHDIKTPEEASVYIKKYDEVYKKVLDAFLIKRRANDDQAEQIQAWLDDFSLEVVLEAVDVSMMKMKKPNFPYTDGILRNWKEKGVHSIDDVKALQANFSDVSTDFTEKDKQQEKKKSLKKSKYANFKQRDWDFDEIERKQQELLSKSVENTLN